MKRTRVLIASDHLISRAGLQGILGAHEDFDIVGAVGVEESARQAQTSGAEVLVVHISEVSRRSSYLVRELGQRSDQFGLVLVLNIPPHEGVMGSLLRSGALACVLTRSQPSELVRAIHCAARRKRYIDSTLNERVIEELLHEQSHLSMRERQVLEGLARGMTQRNVAMRLGVSTKTVETYRRRLGEKLNLRTREDIVQFALATGILQTEEAERSA